MSELEELRKDIADIKLMLLEVLNPVVSISIEQSGQDIAAIIKQHGPRSPELKAYCKEMNRR